MGQDELSELGKPCRLFAIGELLYHWGMGTRQDLDFLDISIMVISRMPGKLPFDLFIKRAEGAFTRIFNKGEPLDQERMEHYHAKKGVALLYVQKPDFQTYHRLVEAAADHIFRDPKASTTDDILEAIKAMAEMTGQEILASYPIDPMLVHHAAATVQGCLGLMTKDPKALPALFNLIGKNTYAVKHSLSSTIFAMLIAKVDGSIKNDRNLHSLGLGAFVHDVGMTRLSFDPDEKSELSPAEWAALKEHPALGARMLDSIKGVPSEVREIVLQHHEQPNGNGYPNGLHNARIYYPAKIVAVSDAFSALIQKRPFREHAFTPVHALNVLKTDLGKYDSAVLKSLEKLVSPPSE
jgi:HD-GYP domain-containing protein (c-di-GMP phosphodiesterase class II)